jgi:hypothetical protein
MACVRKAPDAQCVPGGCTEALLTPGDPPEQGQQTKKLQEEVVLNPTAAEFVGYTWGGLAGRRTVVHFGSKCGVFGKEVLENQSLPGLGSDPCVKKDR